MVADFQDIGMQINAFPEEPGFSGAARVAGEKRAKVLVLQDERDRIVVDRVLAADERQRRADETQRDAVVRLPHRAGARVDDRYAVRARSIETVVIRVTA